MENLRIAIAELVKLILEKGDFWSKNDHADRKEKNTLENRQETAYDSQKNENPSNNVSDKFF
ncbi:MAG: hypothetical protein A4E66_00398 [Syntrophus sp. PtaB.Bin001]|nr:MAG: hypothetical protein A4E66_00398 [Syntrophus sp. PtaB.Bin001]